MAREMESVSSSVQKQIAGIMDELSRAAVQEIGRVLDDGVLLLRLQVCERQQEIESLKQNLQVVSEELRQTRRALLRQCVSGGRSGLMIRGAKEKGKTVNDLEKEPRNEEPPGTTEKTKAPSEVFIKLESSDDHPAVAKKNQRIRTDPDPQSSSTDEDQAPQVWSSETDTEIQDPHFYSSQRLADRPSATEQDYDMLDGGLDTEDLDDDEELSADDLHATADELLRGPNCAELTQSLTYTHSALAHPPHDGQVDFGALGVVSRGRPMVGIGLEKRRFACAFCIKSFDRLSHLDRHQRIHTGEKPFSCLLCGRSFTQKSSLKSHLKTHRGFTAELDAAPMLPHENNLTSDEWSIAKHCEEQIVQHFEPNAEEQDGHTSYLVQESPRFIKPEEESGPGPHGEPDLSSPLSRISNFAAAKRKPSADLHMRNEVEELEKEVLEDCRLEEPKRSDSGSDCLMDEEDLGVSTSQTANLDPDSERPEILSSTAASQNMLQFDSTSAALHSWGSAEGSGTLKISHANQIRVKQEEDDAIPLGDKVPKLNTSYILHPQDPNAISPSDRSAVAQTLRTMEASEGLDLCNDTMLGRQRTCTRRERRFLCVLCGKSFDRMSHLDRHQRIHTGEKPYSCVTCGRSFTQKSSLKGHMRTHTEERAFSCSLCGMSFPTRASQYRHQCSVQPSC